MTEEALARIVTLLGNRIPNQVSEPILEQANQTVFDYLNQANIDNQNRMLEALGLLKTICELDLENEKTCRHTQYYRDLVAAIEQFKT